jgi:hypothetical protein
MSLELGWRHFQECGWPSWLVLLAGLLAVVASTVAFGVALFRVRWANLMSWVALALALAPLGVGGLGVALGRSKVDSLLSSGAIDPSVLSRIRDEGYREAGRCIEVGATASALPLLLALLALAALFMPRSGSADRAGR